MTTCRSCGAPIIWAITESGKRIPIDAGPTAEGNIELKGERAHVLARDEVRWPDTRYYTSHFVTCPHAAQHRKAK